MVLKNKAENFYNGYIFPVCIASLVALCHVFDLVHLGVLLASLLCSLGFLVCRDLKFFICPLLCLYFIISERTLANEELYSTSSIVFLSVCIVVLIGCIVAHFIIYRKEIDLKPFVNSKLRNGFILISVLFIINGMLAFKIYNSTNLIFGLLIAISFILPFFIFSINLKIDRSTVDYLMNVLMIIAGVVAIELICLYFTDVYITEEGIIVKDSIKLGWGISNNVGAVLAMLMPAFFYRATRSRLSFLYFMGGISIYLLVIMTLSRASILFSTLCLALCLLFMCFGKYRGRGIIIGLTSVIFVAGIFLFFHFKEDLRLIFHGIVSAGLDGSDRLKYYIDGLNKFLEHPILGAGFGNSHGVNDKFIIASPEYFHNTIIQVLASCGILGFAAYSYHRYETVKLLIKNRNTEAFFTAAIIMTLLLTSLLDIHMFNIFPAFFYSVILCIFERSSRELKLEPDDKAMISDQITTE